MDREDFEAELNAAWKALDAGQQDGIRELVVIEESRTHPLLPSYSVPWLGGLGHGPDDTLREPYREGELWFSWPGYSTSPLANQSDGLPRLLRSVVFDHHATRLAYTEHAKDEDRFAAHACFRRDEPLYDGWYRSAEILAPLTWTIDLDLFVELSLPRETYGTFRQQITLTVLGIEHKVAIPDDWMSTLDEDNFVLTLEGAGLIDGDTEQGNEDALADATTGNLNLMLCLY